MPQSIIFQRGDFQKFKATREISIGNLRPPHGYKVVQGEIIEFDGFQVRIGTGETVESPSTRGAIAGGWFVPASAHEDPVVVSPRTPVTSRGQSQVLQYEDQIVAQRGSAGGFQRTAQAPMPHTPSLADRLLTQIRSHAQGEMPQPQPVPQTQPTQAGRRPKFAVVQQEELENEGIPLRTLRPQTEAPKSPVVSLGEGVIEDQRTIGRIQTQVRTEGPISIEETARVRKSVTDSIIVADKATVGNEDATHPSLRRRMVADIEDQGGQTVSRVRTPTQFTGQVNTTTDIRSQISRLEKQATIVPGNNSQAPIASSDPRAHLKVRGELRDNLVLGTLQYFIPNFAWNKNRRVDERVRDALDHAEDPFYLKGIYVFESEEVQAQILQAVPDLLSQ